MRKAARVLYQRYPMLCQKILGEEKMVQAASLYPGKMRQEVGELLWQDFFCQMGWTVMAVLCLMLAALVSGVQKSPSIQAIERPQAGKAAIIAEVAVCVESNWLEGKLQIGAREFEDAEIDKMHTKIENYLEQTIAGENADLRSITEALLLPTVLEVTAEDGTVCPVQLSWSSDRAELVTKTGEVNNEELTEEAEVTIHAKVFYGEEFRVFSKQVRVLPKPFSPEEQLYRSSMKELQRREEQARTDSSFLLPTDIEGIQVSLVAKEKPSELMWLAGLSILLLLLSYHSFFGRLQTKRKKRMEEAKQEYREFVSKFALLLAAGLSTRAVWGRLAGEYEKKKKSMLAEELLVSERELGNGKSEGEVYEAFGNRMGLIPYQRLASLLGQQVTKGVQGMQQLLFQEVKEVTAQEQEQIKIRGEEAGTKLLLPMMGLLIMVFAILLVPAFRTF